MREPKEPSSTDNQDTSDAAGTDPSGGSPLVQQVVIPGRPIIDVGPGATLHARIEEDDDEDEDDDDVDFEIDDGVKLDDLRDRLECEGGRKWVEIAATLESITVAMEIRGEAVFGCLVRTTAWSYGGAESEEHHSSTWIPGVTLADLQRGSAVTVIEGET